VILLDLMMPEMDGFEVVAALQANAAWRDIPVVVITALDLTAEDQTRLSGGVEQILSKRAFPPTELMARVCALLEGAEKPQKRAGARPSGTDASSRPAGFENQRRRPRPS
jgi:CheY-like chemotaxis protein